VDLGPTTKRKEQPRVLYGGSAQTRSMAGASTRFSSDDVSMRDPHCEVMLSGSANHFEVMLSGSTKVGFSPPKKERKKGEKPIEGMGKWHTTLLGS